MESKWVYKLSAKRVSLYLHIVFFFVIKIPCWFYCTCINMVYHLSAISDEMSLQTLIMQVQDSFFLQFPKKCNFVDRRYLDYMKRIFKATLLLSAMLHGFLDAGENTATFMKRIKQ